MKTKEQIGDEWTAAYKSALEDCPKEFLPSLTRFAFLGQDLILEAWVSGLFSGKDAAEEALNRAFAANAKVEQ